MINSYKEIEIPITWEQVWKILLICGWSGIIISSFNVDIHDQNSAYTAAYLVLICMTLTCTLIVPITYSWDMNPFHKIGYCIKFKDNKQPNLREDKQ